MTDTAWEEQVDLLGDVGYQRISGPTFSADGALLAFTLHNDQTGGEDLMVLSDKGVFSLVADGAANRNPSFSPDGRHLLYASDRTGVHNVYAITLGSGAHWQVSHVTGGLFSPVVDAQRRWLYVLSYRGKGYEVARTRWVPEQWTALGTLAGFPLQAGPADEATASGNEPSVENLSAPVEPDVAASSPPNEQSTNLPPTLPSRSYSSFEWLKPQYVLPSVALWTGNFQLGVRVGAIDPLFFQTYDFDLRYDTATRSPVGRFEFLAAQLKFPLQIQLIRDAIPLGTDPSSPVMGQFSGEVLVHFPIDGAFFSSERARHWTPSPWTARWCREAPWQGFVTTRSSPSWVTAFPNLAATRT